MKIIAVRPRPHYGSHPSRPPEAYVVGQSSGEVSQPYHHTEHHYVPPVNDSEEPVRSFMGSGIDEQNTYIPNNASTRFLSQYGSYLLIASIAFGYYFLED